MPQTARCPRCGATLPPGRADCPACLVQLGLEAERASDADDESPSRVRERRRAPPPTPAELAADFPQLEILEVVGEGGMGVVYRARHKQLERELALKILAGELAADARFEERFVREARALAKLDHPGIVHVHDFGRAGTRWFLLMEFVDGTNLRSLMKEHKLAARDALAIVPQICDALQYAHDEGVVHRDIKPENVLIDAKGRVKLVDFGLAKLVGAGHEPQHTASGTVVGTAHYIAPEQIARPREVDHRADIYSLGVVFYEMLTGELPLGRFEPPSKRVQVDVRLDEIVLKSLERAPERRYQHAVEVKTDVDEVTSHPAPLVATKERDDQRREGARHDRGTTLDFVLYAVAWIAIGVAFNHGPIPFFAASLLLLLIAARAQKRAIQRREVRWTPVRSMVAVALFPLGFAALFAGLVAFAEADRRDYDPGFDDSPQAVVRGLETIRGYLVEESGGAAVTSKTVRLLTDLDVPNLWRHRWMVLLGLGIWFAALSLPSWKRRSLALQLDGSAALRALLIATTPLGLIFVAQRIGSAAWPPSVPSSGGAGIEEDWRVKTTVDEAVTRARIALLGLDYQIHTEIEFELDLQPVYAQPPSNAPKSVRVLYADVTDVFRRLHVTWRGVKRALPVVSVYLCERRDASLTVSPRLGQLQAHAVLPARDPWFKPEDALTNAFRDR